MKVVQMYFKKKPTGAVLVSENEFSKSFKYGDTELFIGKAFDEDSDLHYLVHSIPAIMECNVNNLQYPVPFKTEQERDTAYTEMGTEYTELFIEQIIAEVKFRNSQQAEE